MTAQHVPSPSAISECAKAVDLHMEDTAIDFDPTPESIAEAVLRCAVERCGYPDPNDRGGWVSMTAHELLLAKLKEVEKERDRMRAALELIAMPARADGTYNRCREACEKIARDALEGKA